MTDPIIGFFPPASHTRLEPLSRSGNPAAALSAAVADPLWMLMRQYQFGEFVGEDAGTPVSVQVQTTSAAVHSWGPSAGLTFPVGPDPVDSVVEREPAGDRDYLTRARLGFDLIKRLRTAGLGAVADGLPRLAPLDAPPGAPAAAVAPLLTSRSADPDALYRALQAAGPTGIPILWGVRPGQEATFRGVVADWKAVYTAATPSPPSSTWNGPRLEYSYRLEVQSGAVGTTLTAKEATSGRGQWWSFDASTGAVGFAPTPGTTTHTAAATPLRYPGMPADRFWEFEDAKVNLGALEVQPHDLARLLVAECALIFGCDWLNIPIDADGSSLVTVKSVHYRTTFGETFTVPPSRIGNPTAPWRMFAVSAAGSETAVIDGLVTPPVSAPPVEGPPLEEVFFLRDESANLVWAVERIVPDGLGRGMPRGAARVDAAAPADVAADTELRYLLATSVPAWWVPYVPRLMRTPQLDGLGDRVAMRLVQGRLDCDASAATDIWGRLLAEDRHSVLFDAEVPREGVRVQRVPVLARRPDGTYVSWIARRVSVGRGEGRSGLAFDSAVPHERGRT
ncbi:hypothetical protein AU196_21095 [Mycobacterium sp. IS-1742]|uniref:hypothetical protein n=1 Tax=Mycobacterium sp. IS-1742 TaxID=1772285 RepID=UPI0007402820|nr:hypothetical protein [Mycobacterium sp. IS-1742]KUI27670.1 hypothetical protein AU196_21095 [Mycobacterium sp. IS-1742]